MDRCRGSAPDSGTPVLPRAERAVRRARLRRVRRTALREVLRGAHGPSLADARQLLPLPADRLPRRHRQRARHRLAPGRLDFAAALSQHRTRRIHARSLDDLAQPPADRCGNSPRSVHLGAAAARQAGSVESRNDRRRCHHAGGQRGAALDRAARQRRVLRRISAGAGGEVGDRNADPRAAGQAGQKAQKQRVQQGLDESA